MILSLSQQDLPPKIPSSRILLIASLLSLAGCTASEPPSAPVPADVEATSLLGKPLPRPSLAEDFRGEQEELLQQARAAFEASPDDVQALIWIGRRTAYLGLYGEAVEIFTRGIELHPEDPWLYRHRGHRHITLRRLKKAVADLERASQLIAGRPDEVEPDGLPNALGIPTSTLHTNIWYHLGLARYLQGDFAAAAEAYRACLEAATNPDMTVATVHWLYMTLRRLGDNDEAAELLATVPADLEIIENHDYFRLLRMYRGESTARDLLAAAAGSGDGVASATVAYGVGNWYLYHRQDETAERIFRDIVASDAWAAFGYIAAEADLARGTGK